MISFKHAEAISRMIRATFGKKLPDWFLGSAINTDKEEGFTISVRVLKGHARDVKFDKRIDGVKVSVVEEREMARPLRSNANRPQKKQPPIPAHIQAFLAEAAAALRSASWKEMPIENAPPEAAAKGFIGTVADWSFVLAAFNIPGSRGHDGTVTKGGVVMHLPPELAEQGCRIAEAATTKT